MCSWCDHCVKGKSRDDDHKPRKEPKDPNEVPRVCLDYCFLNRVLKGADEPQAETVEELKTPGEDAESSVPVLVIVDERSGAFSLG